MVACAGLIERFEGLGRDAADELLGGLVVRVGVAGDYAGLSGFHYLRSKPVTFTRVLVVEAADAGVAGRFRAMCGDGCGGDRDGVMEGRGRVVGVLVESLPALGCWLRDEALEGRYGDWDDRGAAARLLNDEMRCVSRVVIHPQWRGLGLAVRLVRAAIAGMTTPYLEALAAMGRVHPFFELAGMRAYRRWPLEKDQRLLDAMRYAGLEVWRLAGVDRMERWLMGGDGEAGEYEKVKRQLVSRELARWAGRRLSVRKRLELARAKLLCEPVYYLKDRALEGC